MTFLSGNPTILKRMKRISGFLAMLSFLCLGVSGAAAQDVVLFNFEEGAIPALKLRYHATASIDKDGSSPALKLELPAGEKYPGAGFVPADGGGWDLSAFKGVEAEVTNAGNSRLAVTLRVDNPGDGAPETWNAEAAGLSPGETKVLTVTFGKTWGQPGAQIDPAHIVEIQIFAADPTEAGALVIRSLKPVP